MSTLNILLVGKKGVGKTSLIEAYLEQRPLHVNPTRRLHVYDVPQYHAFLHDYPGQVSCLYYIGK